LLFASIQKDIEDAFKNTERVLDSGVNMRVMASGRTTPFIYLQKSNG
jgi:tRNA U38,U39,U40 pseudouridine synthase TruA